MIIGGETNTIEGSSKDYATIVGSNGGYANGFAATVLGGKRSFAKGKGATVVGGQYTTADGNWATARGTDGELGFCRTMLLLLLLLFDGDDGDGDDDDFLSFSDAFCFCSRAITPQSMVVGYIHSIASLFLPHPRL